MREETRKWIAADQAHCWHPFTRQAEWCQPGHQPLVVVKGEGVWLWDSEGRRYFDGNSSIWTNIHGHGHPRIVAAIQRQLERVAHTSFLGFTHPGAAELAERLCSFFPPHTLERVFFSDDGSTAVECALKMALQYRLQTDEPDRRGFIAFTNGYHGDTLGAASLGGVGRFFERFRGIGFAVRHVESMDALRALDDAAVAGIAGVVIEPLIQGVNEMRPWPPGMLRELRAWCDGHGVHLILDEVMTGFGRTGTMFACQQESVVPDFLCLAKGLTGGCSPLAATLTTAAVYEAFLGSADRAFYYGHSFTAHPLGCAAALASLEVFAEEQTLAKLPERIAHLRHGLAALQSRHPVIHEVRQCGLVAGIELRQPDGQRFAPDQRRGEAVCLAARAHGLLTRPILDTVVLLPPLCATPAELDHALAALDHACGGVPLVPAKPGEGG
ncbi:MAG: adenosylmethionine--8-amino-7-oxononanoate transaminase [Akkermansiaceae bacterium]|nr:adenosylmethionine--8-amino-7-oxononanoate transaminase [Akkermansiaceae bacterium]MCF7732142.1 adenosylmethionine--8-amino-7-oxononanoate transaminase [Akkermansiaceae bacterium]